MRAYQGTIAKRILYVVTTAIRETNASIDSISPLFPCLFYCLCVFVSFTFYKVIMIVTLVKFINLSLIVLWTSLEKRREEVFLKPYKNQNSQILHQFQCVCPSLHTYQQPCLQSRRLKYRRDGANKLTFNYDSDGTDIVTLIIDNGPNFQVRNT